ncbi:MAG: SUMF1/EgtB/PvdO family nonheme iron enzyme [Gammaproteobacteria bacterium]|nr:SUMF1/EgtB/PvdO family nonheme iron enzyme [Gammaproteobacteria bacterium]MBU1725818.1 SUMF1/EgtB/PvdO family nonheme iron enzyme [Gammaproteobacteria bacterium]MBU2007321.1 SUMF1/EgtB/PvdO family nonheme iron enzyme [Gammaproteobacteria bacterium]
MAYALFPVYVQKREEGCARRVSRGGSWNNNGVFSRPSARNRNNTDNRNNNVGLRVLRASSPPLEYQAPFARVRLPTVSRSVRWGVHDLLSRLRKDGKAK